MAATANGLETPTLQNHALAGATPSVTERWSDSKRGREPNKLDSFPGGNAVMGNGNGDESSPSNGVQDEIKILCGPLLNYKGMRNAGAKAAVWRGSVLIVTQLGHREPELKLQYKGPWNRDREASGNQTITPSPTASSHSFRRTINGLKLYEDSTKTFWRFAIDLPLQAQEACWDYSLANTHIYSTARPQSLPTYTFIVPSMSQSMRMMFHSCNGFSVGTDEEAWSGPALWNDVLRRHKQAPFHVMIGGGDQIYNDAVRVKGPLKAWTDIGNPVRRREYPFDKALMAACDSFYFENYANWYSTEPFAKANSQIPQVNIWDDHDIIDGFGSYTDHFMKCPVFRGIGSVSFKYYCLFQLHIPPPKYVFTTPPTRQTMHAPTPDIANAEPAQIKNTYVLEEPSEDPSFILGAQPGPYISERSRSLYMRLGARLAFLGIDARTERTRHMVNYPETYDIIFERVQSELLAAGKGAVEHLIILLGVPIAYPRLIWLENMFTSPIIGPIRFLSKRFGLAGGFFNHFDGQIDLLDDLDDHYTARHHKDERKGFLFRLQALAQANSIRITILGGDVHLGAVGRFYSKPKLGIPVEQDHRYMTNIISSAITNKPPPKAVADLLARRNKIHHLDHDTDETLMKLFNKDPGNSTKTGNFNKVTMPSRNYAIIAESRGSSKHTDSVQTNGHPINGDAGVPKKKPGKSNDGHYPIHAGEEGAGTEHPAANGSQGSSGFGGLDVCIRVEIDQHDKEGRTEGYGFNIPALKLKGESVRR